MKQAESEFAEYQAGLSVPHNYSLSFVNEEVDFILSHLGDIFPTTQAYCQGRLASILKRNAIK